jgi:hypothetical protein
MLSNTSKIQFEGPRSRDPLAFKHDNPKKVVERKAMKKLSRFSAAGGNTYQNRGASKSTVLSIFWLILSYLGLACLPASAQMVEGRKIPGFHETFGETTNEASNTFKAI